MDPLIQPSELNTPERRNHDTSMMWYRLRNPEFSPLLPLTGSPGQERLSTKLDIPKPGGTHTVISHETIEQLPDIPDAVKSRGSAVYTSRNQLHHDRICYSTTDTFNTPTQYSTRICTTGKVYTKHICKAFMHLHISNC